MQSLSATLKAAQQRFDVDARVSVLVSDLPPETPRVAGLTSLYSGSEPDASFDACYLTSGQIGRAYADGAGNVYAQVVTPPGSPAAWSTWYRLDATAYSYAGAGGPVAVWASGSQLVVYWLAADGHTIRWASYLSGSWSGMLTAVDAGAGWLVSGLAADSLDPTQRFFYVVSGGQVFETHWTGTGWSTPAGDGQSYTLPEIGAGYLASANGYSLVITYGNPTTLKRRSWTVSSGWASTSTDQVLLQAGVGSGYSYASPRIGEVTSTVPRTVITWAETAPAPLGTVSQICFTPNHGWVTNVVPWRYAATHGVRVFRDTSQSTQYWWVITSNQVYRCQADSASASAGQRIRFTQDEVVSLKIDVPRENHPAAIAITVLNPEGVLATAGQAGAYLGLRQWSQVAITLGYHTASGNGNAAYGLNAGDEGVVQLPCWIEQVVFHDDIASGMPLVTLHCVDAWGILERVRVRSSVTYTGLTAAQLLALIWWQVAGTPASGLAQLSGLTVSPFTLNAGETYARAARRLGEICGVCLRFKTSQTSADGTGWDSVIAEAVPWASGGSVYSYGPNAGQQPIVQSLVAPYVEPSATSVELSGASTVSRWRDWTSLWLLWRELTERLVDKTLANQAATDAAAGYVGSWLSPEQRGGELEALVNVGLEVGDQVDITIPTAPISAQVYTVAGYLTSWDRARGVIVQTLRLEGSN